MSDAATPPEEQTGEPSDLVVRWLGEIEDAERRCQQWHERASKIVKRYRDERGEAKDQADARRFNILWSNVQVLQPSIYAKPPKPYCVRRYHGTDPVGRKACELVEKGLTVQIEVGDLDTAAKYARDDRLFSGRGVIWVRYEPTFGEPEPLVDPMTGQPQVDPMTGEPVLGEKPVIDERIAFDFVHHKDFLHGNAPMWSVVPWVAKRAYMTKTQVRERWPDTGIAERLNYRRDKDKSEKDEAAASYWGTTVIWEIWDRERKEVLWISPDYKDEPIERTPDPLGLKGFFPCPAPFYGTITPETLIPVPDFAQYQDQAAEIDGLTQRIGLLTDAIRVCGFYAASDGNELANLLTNTTGNELVPYHNWAALTDMGGLAGAVSYMPLDPISGALQALFTARTQAKTDLYEVTGMSDIIRGQSNPNETATAQQIKSQFGTLRLQQTQQDMQRFLRDAMAIAAEAMVENFAPERLCAMAGCDPQDEAVGQALQLLKDDAMRTFRVDIETDSTVQADEEADKASRVEFLQAVGVFLKEALQVGQAVPQMLPLLGQMLLFGVKGFRVGRELEQVLEDALAQLQQAAEQAMAMQQQAAQNPQPDPAQVEQQRGEQELAMKAERQNAELALKAQKQEAELALKARAA